MAVNAYNFDTHGNRSTELPSLLPSNTVPNQALSLRTLLDRHNNGGHVTQYKPVYLGDDDSIPVGFERMDAAERAQMAKNLADFVKTTRGELMTKREAAQKAANDRAIDALVQERLKAARVEE